MATLAKLLVQVGVKLDGALKVKQNVRGLKKSTKDMADSADRDTSRVRRSFRRMGTTIRTTATKAKAHISGWVDKMGGMRNVMLAAVGALTAAAGATFKWVDSQTAAIDSTNKLSKAVGVGVEELQRLQFAAGQSGLSEASLQKGILKLNDALQDLTNNKASPATRALEGVGIMLRDLDGLSRTQQIGLIGERLQGIEDPALRAAAAADIFGKRAGPEMASLLALGRDGLEELGASAANVFSQADADRASDFQDRMGELRSTVQGLGQSIAFDLLPMVNDIIVEVRHWLEANREVIQQDVGAFVSATADQFRDLATILGTVAEGTRLVRNTMSELSAESETTSFSLGGIADTFWSMLNPISMVANAIRDARSALIEIGAIDATPIGAIAGKVVGRARDLVKERGLSTENPIFGVPPMLARPTGGGRSRRRGGGGGGGRSRPKPKPKPAKKPKETSSVTYKEAIASILNNSGTTPELLQSRLSAMGSATPPSNSIKPTVAMTVNINNNDIDITQNISNPDPAETGRQAAASIQKLFDRAGLSFAASVLR